MLSEKLFIRKNITKESFNSNSKLTLFILRNIITLPNSRYVAALFKQTSNHTNDFGLIVYDLVDMKIVRQANLVSNHKTIQPHTYSYSLTFTITKLSKPTEFNG